MNPDDKRVFIVFNIDAEGPATEGLQHTFKRIRDIYGLRMEPTRENLKRLQEGNVPQVDDETRLGLRTMVAPERLAYLNNWEQVGGMLDEFLSERWRRDLPDSYGGGYVYSFYTADLVHHEYNPRRKPMGYHQVYDFYREKLDERPDNRDEIHWHYHGPGFVRHAYLDVFNLSHTDHHLQILSRRVIDRLYFPNCFRPGMDLIRPDHNLFLEQWIPFDYSNQGAEPSAVELAQKDNAPGRFGDWRRAPRDWIVFHPDYLDYQKIGSMKRYVARCLYTKGRFRPVTQEEMDRGFERASRGQKTIISFICHDSRDMTLDLQAVNPLIEKAAEKYPDVRFQYAGASQAMRRALDLPPENPAQFELKWVGDRFEIRSDKPLWGPQPYFCFQTWDYRYYHDNLDRNSDTEWSYTFDWQTVDKRAVARIGVASNDDYGNTTVAVWDADAGDVTTRILNTDED